MIKEAINRIVELGQPATVTVDGQPYSTANLKPVLPPVAEPLVFEGLEGLAKYIKTGPDKLGPEKLAVHVVNHQRVEAISGHVQPGYRRHTYAAAACLSAEFGFGRFYPHEAFMIALQSLFVDTQERGRLLQLAAALTAEEIRTVIDSGVAQEVTARAGVVQKERVTIQNPVVLGPYRTFREVSQPESAFIFRVQKSGRGELECALFEADGGVWRLEAIDRVYAWLKERLFDITVLA